MPGRKKSQARDEQKLYVWLAVQVSLIFKKKCQARSWVGSITSAEEEIRLLRKWVTQFLLLPLIPWGNIQPSRFTFFGSDLCGKITEEEEGRG